MSEKVDYKKTYKELYAPQTVLSYVNVPAIKFAVIEGIGDPNGEAFARAVEALYGLSYAVKMSYKSTNAPTGYYEYTVFPLEGVWDLIDKGKAVTDKSNFRYWVMIRQPEFLTMDLFERFTLETKKKKPNECLDKIRFEEIEEGLCCQMLHVGSYDSEPASFERMEEFCKKTGHRRSVKTHREIYLSDLRRTETSKLKTILRFQVEKI